MKLRVSSNLNASILLVACAGMLAPAFAQTAAGSYPSDGGLAAKIQPFVDNNIIPGAVLLVADKDKILDLESVGYSDIDKKVPMDPNNLIMICSMTKTERVDPDLIKEVILHSVVYCGVPAANSAFKAAGEILAELTSEK